MELKFRWLERYLMKQVADFDVNVLFQTLGC